MLPDPPEQNSRRGTYVLKPLRYATPRYLRVWNAVALVCNSAAAR
jgi:hypothetical protein